MDDFAASLHNVDLRLLRIFKKVVECRGFSAAEETLGIGRSTISKHMGDLEIRLGLRLCERGRSGFAISADGEVVYQATVELLDALEQFQARVTNTKQRLTGELRLWLMDHTIWEIGNPIGDALRRLQRRPGDLQLTVSVTTPEEAEQAVASRRAHIALTICNSALPGLLYRHIGEERSSLYCGRSHPDFGHGDQLVGKDDLKGARFVARGYLIDERITQSSQAKAVALHVEATLQLLLTGDFVAVVPDHIAQPWLDAGLLSRIECEEYRRNTPIYLVMRQQSLDLSPVKAAVEDITAAYSAKKLDA